MKHLSYIVFVSLLSATLLGMEQETRPTPPIQNRPQGELTLITGPMFAGKTSTLIKKIEEARTNGKRVQVFKPLCDTRSAPGQITTHEEISLPAIGINSTEDLKRKIDPSCDVYAFDEFQFYHVDFTPSANFIPYGDENFAPYIVYLVQNLNKIVWAAGLNLTYNRKQPFKNMLMLAPFAKEIVVREAKCTLCKCPHAQFTQRVINGQKNAPTFIVGGKELYQPRCSHCYEEPK